MFFPCRPCCGAAGDPCGGDVPDSIEVDISYIGYKLSTPLPFPSLGSGLNSATYWYDTLQLAVHPTGGSQDIYASVANYAILNHLDGSFVLSKTSSAPLRHVYNYTDPSGFDINVFLDYAINAWRLRFSVNGGPELRTLHKYSATPETQANMAAATWNAGATNCTPLLAVCPPAYGANYSLFRMVPYSGSTTFSLVGPTWNPFSATNCQNVTVAGTPAASVNHTCGSVVIESAGPYADFGQVPGEITFSSRSASVSGMDFTNGVFFDSALNINWTAYTPSLSAHQFNPYYPTPSAPEVWTDGSGAQWVVAYSTTGPLGVGLGGTAKDTAISIRNQITRLQANYAGSLVDIFPRI